MYIKYRKRLVSACGSGVIILGWFLLAQLQSQPIVPSNPTVPVNAPSRKMVATSQETLKDFQKTEFYRTIIDNNLFRPLGWHPPRQKEIYRLLGTLIPTDENTPSQAILQSTTTRTTHIVSIGDRLDAETTVTDIQPKKVILEKAGQKPRILTLNPTLLRK